MERLTYEQIQTIYPHMYVGLTNVEYGQNTSSVRSATVLCTSENTSYDDLLLKALKNEIFLIHTAPNDGIFGGVIE